MRGGEHQPQQLGVAGTLAGTNRQSCLPTSAVGYSLARKVFHGDKGELYQRYRDGMEDQLGALGLVLNCIVLWNTVYINAALERLRAAGYPVREEDVVRLHPFMRRHIAVQGDYSFLLPALAGRLRDLRDPTEAPDEDEEED